MHGLERRGLMNRKGFRPGRMIAASVAVLAGSLVWQQAGLAGTEAPVSAEKPAMDVSKLSKDEIETYVYERQQIMIQLNKDTEALGDIVAGVAPANKLAEITRSIAKGAKDSHSAFLLKIPGGRTKPEAWSNWADYAKRMEAFVASTENLAKLGETGSVHAVTDVLGDALPCKACHDLYREPKKPS